MDERLNESGYIIPGLGDAGDRLFGGSDPRLPRGRPRRLRRAPAGGSPTLGYVDGQAPTQNAGVAAQRLRQLRTSLALSQEQLAHLWASPSRPSTAGGRAHPDVGPALRALAEFEAQATASPLPGTLPVPHSSFVGREAELAS